MFNLEMWILGSNSIDRKGTLPKLSIAMITKHRQGLNGDKSSLFYEYYRLLKEVSPQYFLLENVGSMNEKE